MHQKNRITLSKLDKSNVWSIDENDLFRMLLDAQHDEDYSENKNHYMNIIHSVFDIQSLNRDDVKKKEALEAQHYEIFHFPNQGDNNALAIRKRPIKKITDLTLENIHHIEPAELLSLIEKNLGTGWDGLSLQIKDIINSAFYVDTAKLPERTMHRIGGIIDKRKADGYEVLELMRGTWIEALFVKSKPKQEKLTFQPAGSDYKSSGMDDIDDEDDDDDDDEDGEDLPDNSNDDDDDDDFMESDPDMVNIETENIEDIVASEDLDDED